MKPIDVSCGTLVVDRAGRLLLGHVTGTAKWDIPKGLQDPGEDTLAAAMRELYEEAGLEFEVAREIRRTPALPQPVLIALTGWGAQSDQAQSQEAGFDQHLTKPVSLEALEQALATAPRSLR